MLTLMHPIVGFERSQLFGELPTAGVAPNQYGTAVQQLVYSYGNYQPFGHDGWDYACPVGTPVYAAADGIVEFAGDGTYMPDAVALKWAFTTDPAAKWATGKAVLLGFGEVGAYTAHMDDVVVQAGQWVAQGQLIGYSGTTGRSGGPHCHFSVVVFAQAYSNALYGRTDPARYVDGGIIPLGNITPEEQEGPMFGPQEKVFTAIDGAPASLEDLLRSLDSKISDAKVDAKAARDEATAAKNLAGGLLNTRFTDPTDPEKSYTVAEFIVWGATNAKHAAGASAQALHNISPEVLAAALGAAQANVSAADVAALLDVSVSLKKAGTE